MATNGEPDLTGYSLEGCYVFKRHLGSGAFGSVWLCEQSALDRYVAIKVLKREGNPAQARFLKEARLASKLDHPNAAHVYGFGVAEPPIGFWIAMEFVAGVTLDKWLEKHARMTPEQFVPFFRALAGVVQAAHDRNIVHRDLKPSNVMVVEHRGRLVPKLLDLGIAREGVYPTTIADDRSAEFHAEDRVAIEALADVAPGGEGVVADVAPADDVAVAALPAAVQGEGDAAPRSTADAGPSARPPDLGETHRGVGAGAARGRLTPLGFRLGHLGTQHYMSPEQWANPSEVGHESDLYALGVIAFQCLVGRVPFHAEDSRDLHLMHLTRPVPSLGAAFSAEVDGVVARALAKAPSDRYATVVEFAEALASALRRLPQRQLTSRAQVWDDAERPASLLLNRSDLLHMEARSELERAFLTASHEHAARGVRRRLVLLTLGATCLTAIGALTLGSYLVLKAERAERDARVAKAVAENTVTQANLEQGRSELLHSEPGAAANLAKAYQRDPQPATAFMLSRALQPLLAERARIQSSSGRMWSAAFSPDGSQFVTTDDKNAQIWDAQSYRLRFTLPNGSEVYLGVYRADGKQLATAAQDAIRLWDTSTGALVREMRQKPGDSRLDFYTVAFSRDGKLVAALDVKGAVAYVWNAVTGAELAELQNDGSGFPGLAFSADGLWFATTGGSEARVFDTRTWALVRSIPHVRRLAFDPTISRLLTGGANGDVSIWEVARGVRIRHLRELGEIVDAVAVSPDGQLVAAASRDGVEQVWRAESGELQCQFNARHNRIFAVEFDRTSKRVLAAGSDGAVVIADTTLGMPIAVLEGPQNEVRTARFDPASRVLGASADGTARLWDAAAPYYRWSSPATSDNCGPVSSPDSDRGIIAIRCKNQPTRIWDTARRQLVAELPSVAFVTGDFASASPAVSAKEDRVAIARGNDVEVYELPSRRLLQVITHTAPVNVAAFAMTGRDLITGTVEGSLLISRDNGTRIALPPAPGGIDAVAMLPDGRLVSSDARRRLRVYDLGGTLLADLELPVRTVSLRMDGSRLVTVPLYPGKAAPPVLLDLERYRVVAELVGHIGRVYSARWIAGGRILTAGGDGTARLWDGATGQLLHVYRGGSRFLADVALAPGGFIVAGGADGLLRFWDPISERLLWTLPVDKSPLVGIHVEGNDIVTRGFSGELSRWTFPNPEQVIQEWGEHKR